MHVPPDALECVQVPLTVKAGVIGKLSCKVPATFNMGTPVVVSLEK